MSLPVADGEDDSISAETFLSAAELEVELTASGAGAGVLFESFAVQDFCPGDWYCQCGNFT